MTFDNTYPNRKDHRTAYRGAKAFDRSCRPHGGCPCCADSRCYQDTKARLAADAQLREYAMEGTRAMKRVPCKACGELVVQGRLHTCNQSKRVSARAGKSVLVTGTRADFDRVMQKRREAEASVALDVGTQTVPQPDTSVEDIAQVITAMADVATGMAEERASAVDVSPSTADAGSSSSDIGGSDYGSSSSNDFSGGGGDYGGGGATGDF